jgi:hypothetical protein
LAQFVFGRRHALVKMLDFPRGRNGGIARAESSKPEWIGPGRQRHGERHGEKDRRLFFV